MHGSRFFSNYCVAFPVRLWPALMLLCAVCFWTVPARLIGADAVETPAFKIEGEFTQRSGDMMLIVNSRPLSTVTSTVAKFEVDAAAIPDDAVVTKVELRSSGVAVGKPARNGAIMSVAANILGPGMAEWAKKPWGRGNATLFTARELGPEPPAATGEWLVSYDGRNLSDRLPGYKGHKGLSLRIYYESASGR